MPGQEILIENGKAVGVRYVSGRGRRERVVEVRLEICLLMLLLLLSMCITLFPGRLAFRFLVPRLCF